MTPAELRELTAVMRETGVSVLTIGDTRIELGAAPHPYRSASPPAEVPAVEGPKPEPPEPMVGPDGKVMSATDQILFASSLGTWPEEEAAQ